MEMKGIFIILLFFSVIISCGKKTTDEKFYAQHPEWLPPEIIQKGQIVFPDSVKTTGIIGTVLVECTIDTTGNVVESQVIKTTNDTLNSLAIETVKDYKFKSGMLGAEKVRSKIVIPVKFE
jgi:TonB family protein